MTYKELFENFCRSQNIENGSQSAKNYNSTLSTWLGHHRLTFESVVGDEFGKNFEQNVKEFSQAQVEGGLSNSTLPSYVSRLRKLQKFSQKAKPRQQVNTFKDMLQHLLSEKGYTAYEFHQKYLTEKCSYSRLYRWLKGRLPYRHSLSSVEEIERIFQVPPGTLTDFLPMRKTANYPQDTTSYGERKRKYAGQYRKWPIQVETEFQGLRNFKSSVIRLAGSKRTKRWTPDSDGQLHSAKITKGRLASFLGFCCLPSDASDTGWCGLGLSEQELSLGLLAEFDYCERHIAFICVRSDGKYHKGVLGFVDLVLSLLRAETGYLWLTMSFAANAGLSKEAWQEKCLATRAQLIELRRDIEEHRNQADRDEIYSRDPNEAVDTITDLSDPLGLMFDKFGLILKDKNRLTPGVNRAVAVRDALLYGFALANPLRAAMFSKMRLEKNLYKDEEGQWWLKFDKKDFKNRNALKSNYKVRLSRRIWAILDEYIEEARPLLLKGKSSEFLFVTNTGKRMSVYHLSEQIFDLTMLYFPKTPGFRLHAFRHIVATGVIKTDRKTGFYQASLALHDQLETVLENYAHLKTSEEFELFNDTLERYADRMKEAA